MQSAICIWEMSMVYTVNFTLYNNGQVCAAAVARKTLSWLTTDPTHVDTTALFCDIGKAQRSCRRDDFILFCPDEVVRIVAWHRTVDADRAAHYMDTLRCGELDFRRNWKWREAQTKAEVVVWPASSLKGKETNRRAIFTWLDFSFFAIPTLACSFLSLYFLQVFT